MTPETIFKIGETVLYRTAHQLRPAIVKDFNLDRSQVYARKLSRFHWIDVSSLQKIEAPKVKKPKCEIAQKSNLPELPSVEGRRIRTSNADFEQACLVHIERLQGGIGDYDSAMMDTFCEAVRLAREYSDAMNIKTK